MAVAGTGVDIRLKIGWEYQVNAAVTRSNRPARNHFGTGQNARVHAAVSRLHVERIKRAGYADMAIARVGFPLAFQVTRFNRAISGPEAHIPFEILDGYPAVAGLG